MNEIIELLSQKRLEKYKDFGTNGIQCHLYNCELAESFYSSLSYFEIILRNKIDKVFSKYLGENWIFEEQYLIGCNRDNMNSALSHIKDTKKNLGDKNHTINWQDHCICKTGYAGPTCSETIEQYCGDSNARWQNDYQYCLCDNNRVGTRCQFDLAEKCDPEGAMYWHEAKNLCECKNRYAGPKCADSLTEYCGTNASTWDSSSQKCVCMPGSAGPKCESDLKDYCNEDNSYMWAGYCMCIPGYGGPKCETPTSELCGESSDWMWNNLRNVCVCGTPNGLGC